MCVFIFCLSLGLVFLQLDCGKFLVVVVVVLSVQAILLLQILYVLVFLIQID